MEIDMGWISTTGVRLPDIEVVAGIEEALSNVPGVLSVEVEQEGSYTVHTTYTGSREGRGKIYDAEMGLMDKYPDILFDFHVAPPEEVKP